MDKTQEKINRMIKNELDHHPESQLIDIYKLFLQSAFGPGHLIKDVNSAQEYLQAEVDNQKKYISQFSSLSKSIYLAHLRDSFKDDNHYTTECPCLLLECNAFLPLIRYSIKFIIDDVIPFKAYFDAFIKTAKMKTFLEERDFLKYWGDTMQYLETKKIDNFLQDKELIESLIAKRQYIVSHSTLYSQKYSPSYRIINKEFLKKYDKAITAKYFDVQ